MALDTLIVIAFVFLAAVIGLPVLIAIAVIGGIAWLLYRAHGYGLIQTAHRT